MCLIMASLSAQEIRVGFISDYAGSPGLERVVSQIVEEIDRTTGFRRKATRGNVVYDIPSTDAARRSYREIAANSDLVIAIGSVCARGLALSDNLSTPVISVGIIDPHLQGIAYEQGASGKAGFTYIWQTRDLQKELLTFHNLAGFENLIVLADAKAVSTIEPVKGGALIDSLADKVGAKLQIVPVAGNLTQVIDQLPTNTDAVYFSQLLSLPPATMQRLIDQLHARKIATFSGSAGLLDLGVLGSMANGNTLQQAIRKLAVMADGIVTGSDPAKMSVRLATKEGLTVNLATAREIELAIPFEVLFTATLRGEVSNGFKTYSFAELAEKSLAANLNIKISYQDVELSEIAVKSARSNLLPSLDAGLTGSQINEERASAAFNSPERSVSGDLVFTQVLYSESAVAGLKVTQYLQKAQEYSTEAEVLNVLFDTYVAYLNVLSAKTNAQIQQENLENTRVNKELADVRVALGSSNNADLYRWEAELAIAQQSVIESQTLLLSAKLQLNTLLANTLDEEYELEDVELEDELFTDFKQGPIASEIRTPAQLDLVSDFLVAESLNQNPTKKALLENIHAANRQLVQNKRLLYVPTVALQAQTSQVLSRGGAGATIDGQAMALGINEFQDNSWFAGITLSLPIFDGLSRKAAIQESKVSLSQLSNANLQLEQNLELGVRSGLLSLLQAGTNINYSKASAQSAQQNFALVQEYYKQGLVNITQLIDAQQAALEARLAAAFSIYEYIQAHLQLELSMGTFTQFMSPEQQADFSRRLQQHVNQQN